MILYHISYIIYHISHIISWRHLGSKLGGLGAMLEHVRPSWLQLEGSGDHLEDHGRKYKKTIGFSRCLEGGRSLTTGSGGGSGWFFLRGVARTPFKYNKS